MNSPDYLLVVDVDPNTRSALRRQLRTGGYAVLEAGNLQECFSAMERYNVAVVLCEPHMPDGRELLREIRRRYPLVQRLVLTGYIAHQEVSDAINEGAVHRFLTKPWEEERLFSEVEAAFSRYRFELELDRDHRLLEGVREAASLRAAAHLLKSVEDLHFPPFSHAQANDLPIGVVEVTTEGALRFVNAKAREWWASASNQPSQEELPDVFTSALRETLAASGDLCGKGRWNDQMKVEYCCKPHLGEEGLEITIFFLVEMRK